MTEQEAIDLEEMKRRMVDVKIKTFDYLVHASRYDERALETSGYRGKTVAQAMESIVRKAMSDIEKIIAAHIRKYPD